MAGLIVEASNYQTRFYQTARALNVADALYDNNQCHSKAGVPAQSTSVLSQIAAAREVLDKVLKGDAGAKKSGKSPAPATGEVTEMRKEIDALKKENERLTKMMDTVLTKLAALETKFGSNNNEIKKPAAAAPAAADDDEDIDLFASDDEEVDEEKERLKQERLDAYAAKKSKKPALVAKSTVLLDVKPWDDETDMKELEAQVRTINMDGLLWGAAKLVPLAYGIKKLQIMSVVEDEKVSIDDLQEKIQEFEDYVQSVDIAAFNKI